MSLDLAVVQSTCVDDLAWEEYIYNEEEKKSNKKFNWRSIILKNRKWSQSMLSEERKKSWSEEKK